MSDSHITLIILSVITLTLAYSKHEKLRLLSLPVSLVILILMGTLLMSDVGDKSSAHYWEVESNKTTVESNQ